MTSFISLPNSILIPLLICAGVVVFFGVMDTIAWIRFKGKQHQASKVAKAAEEAKSAPAASEATNSPTSASASASAVIAASSVSSVNGGDNSANQPSNAGNAESVSSLNAHESGVSADGSMNGVSASENNNEGTQNSQSANGAFVAGGEASSTASNSAANSVSSSAAVSAGVVGGVVLGAAVTSAASSATSNTVSLAAEEGTVSAEASVNSESGVSDTSVMSGVVSSTPKFSSSEVLCNSVVAAQAEEDSHEASESVVASYSEAAANAGAVYGVDGVAGHGSFLLFAFLGGDVANDYYDYYVSPYGDKRRCLYHLYPCGARKIVFDEALVEGEFFPSDYFEYFDEEEGRRSRVHMINGVAGEKEDASFIDPFAPSYDIAAYDNDGQRRLTHYEGENSIIEQVIDDPDIAEERDYTYKDASGVDHLRHNRLAEQPMEEVSVAVTHEEKPAVDEAAAEKKSYKKRVPFLTKLANSNEKLQSQYAEIKELMLSYKTHERASIPCDTYSKHRLVYLKAEVYGKHLNLALRLNPKDYANSTIPTKDVSDKKIYVETPLMVQVRSDLSLRRAKKLIVDMMGNDTKADEEPEEVTPVEEAPIAEEAPVEEAEAGEETKKVLKPRVPFATKLEQADDVLKKRYAEIKAEMEAYGIHSRISIPCDTYSLHRQDYLKITIDGKSLKAFFHLAPKDYDGTSIPHEDQSNKKAYVDTPLLLHVSSDLAPRRAKILIADMMAKADLSKKESK
jgi:hypothetical protein